jgi:decarbamoylnovobiocin carbamoyltransferase/7-O-carbamoyltransferase
MLVLGLNGNFSRTEEDIVPGLQPFVMHDSSASLVRDGVLVAAVEQERFNRIKKTTKFPTDAIMACFDRAGVSASDVDAVGYYCGEGFIDYMLNDLYLPNPRTPVRYSRELMKRRLDEAFGWQLPDDKLVYVPHHRAHATSTLLHSGMSEALVVIIDGRGEEEGISVYRSDGPDLEVLATYPFVNSLGLMYILATMRLGYGIGDEYKVMGLAPYGDPSVYRSLFESLYTLTDGGQYTFNFPATGEHPMMRRYGPDGPGLRRKGEEFTRDHMNFAAALQEALERISLHILEHWAGRTGLRRLAFGGGVAHNCSLNGVILRSGLFDEVFVHPASHDAGAGEGAALAVARQLEDKPLPLVRLRSASFGPELGDEQSIEATLKAWSGVVDYERVDDVVGRTAQLLADDAVLGWAQGSSEFGPRALGNRSIIADPRPQANQTRINAMVKRRESFRPFAPVVTGEDAGTYFEIPAAEGNFEFMSFVLHVRQEHRQALGAVTHVDGTARVQVVTRESNPRFYRLVRRFGELTGTPVLLNTSFNNNAEPIVQTVQDALTTYLTTELDYLVVGDFVVRRRGEQPPAFDDFVPRLRPVTRLAERVAPLDGEPEVSHEIFLDYATGSRAAISAEVYRLLSRADGVRPLAGLGVELTPPVRAELFALWQDRLFTLTPA